MFLCTGTGAFLAAVTGGEPAYAALTYGGAGGIVASAAYVLWDALQRRRRASAYKR